MRVFAHPSSIPGASRRTDTTTRRSVDARSQAAQGAAGDDLAGVGEGLVVALDRFEVVKVVHHEAGAGGQARGVGVGVRRFAPKNVSLEF